MFTTLEPRLQGLSNDIYMPNYDNRARNDDHLKFICAEIWYMFNLLGISFYTKIILVQRLRHYKLDFKSFPITYHMPNSDNRARNKDRLNFTKILNIQTLATGLRYDCVKRATAPRYGRVSWTNGPQWSRMFYTTIPLFGRAFYATIPWTVCARLNVELTANFKRSPFLIRLSELGYNMSLESSWSLVSNALNLSFIWFLY